MSGSWQIIVPKQFFGENGSKLGACREKRCLVDKSHWWLRVYTDANRKAKTPEFVRTLVLWKRAVLASSSAWSASGSWSWRHSFNQLSHLTALIIQSPTEKMRGAECMFQFLVLWLWFPKIVFGAVQPKLAAGSVAYMPGSNELCQVGADWPIELICFASFRSNYPGLLIYKKVFYLLARQFLLFVNHPRSSLHSLPEPARINMIFTESSLSAHPRSNSGCSYRNLEPSSEFVDIKCRHNILTH